MFRHETDPQRGDLEGTFPIDPAPLKTNLACARRRQPMIVLRVVVFPAPFRPSRAVIAPCGAANSPLQNVVLPDKRMNVAEFEDRRHWLYAFN